MTVIGLTGGIASGKSTVADQLRVQGALVIDADRIGHRSYEPGTPGFEKVVNAFGHDLVTADGTIDRRVLGGKVFGAPEEMERLNGIVWPEMRRIIQEEIRDLKRRDREAVVVLEAAVLLEAGWQDLCDEVWVVNAPVKTAVERLASRNALTEDAAMARINAQMSNRERAERADVKIDNAGTEEQLRARVDRCWKALQKRLEEQRAQQAEKAQKARKTRKPAAAASTAASRSGGSRAATSAARPAASRAKNAAPAAKATSRSSGGKRKTEAAPARQSGGAQAGSRPTSSAKTSAARGGAQGARGRTATASPSKTAAAAKPATRSTQARPAGGRAASKRQSSRSGGRRG